MTYRPVDSKREEFRKYLERTGVMDALTKVLVLLYEEESKPDDALNYIRKHLCDGAVEATELEELKTKLEESTGREQKLKEELAQLREKHGEAGPDAAEKTDEEAKTDEAAEKPAEPEQPDAGEKPADGNGAAPEGADAAAEDDKPAE